MFLLRRPTPELLNRVLEDQRDQPLSYPEVGMTRGSASQGYPCNHHRLQVGAGAKTFTMAVAALQRWTMYGMPWTEVFPAETPIETGRSFATVVHHLGFWSTNPCRIVYVDEETDAPVRSWSFAIGTLPAHSEQGEERFQIEWDQQSGEVCFDIKAFARPQHWFAWLGYPYVRAIQRRFGRESLLCVRAALANSAH